VVVVDEEKERKSCSYVTKAAAKVVGERGTMWKELYFFYDGTK
jgi:hypothetical protein